MTTANHVREDGVSRREFISTTAAAGVGLLAGASALAAVAQEPSAQAGSSGGVRRRYALVGVGSRSSMYRDAVLKTYVDHAQMVGFCDVNEGRLKLAQRKARAVSGAEVPLYLAAEFDRMIREVSGAAWATMLLYIALAGIDRPNRVADLAAYQTFIHRLTRAKGDIRLALGQVEVLVTCNELHL